MACAPSLARASAKRRPSQRGGARARGSAQVETVSRAVIVYVRSCALSRYVPGVSLLTASRQTENIRSISCLQCLASATRLACSTREINNSEPGGSSSSYPALDPDRFPPNYGNDPHG